MQQQKLITSLNSGFWQNIKGRWWINQPGPKPLQIFRYFPVFWGRDSWGCPRLEYSHHLCYTLCLEETASVYGTGMELGPFLQVHHYNGPSSWARPQLWWVASEKKRADIQKWLDSLITEVHTVYLWVHNTPFTHCRCFFLDRFLVRAIHHILACCSSSSNCALSS